MDHFDVSLGLYLKITLETMRTGNKIIVPIRNFWCKEKLKLSYCLLSAAVAQSKNCHLEFILWLSRKMWRLHLTIPAHTKVAT